MKKRVLVFVPEFPVTTETFIERELTELAKSPKIELAVYSLKKGRGEVSETLAPLVKYINISFPDIVVGKVKFLFSNPSRFFSVLQSAGFKGYYTFAKSLGYAKAFSEFKPEIIYAHFMSNSSTIAMFAAGLLGVEFSISAHARDILEYPDMAQLKLTKSKFIAICNRNAYDYYLNLCKGMETSRVHLLYHGIPDIFTKTIPQKEDKSENISAAKTSRVKKLLTIGRLVEKKGLTYLIDAFSILSKELTDYTLELNIIGGGPLLETLTAQVKNNKLEGKVFLRGELPFSETHKFIVDSDVYVQPSINASSGDADGIPNTLIEAAMASMPIVTTNAGSIAEFLDKNNSMIVPQRDTQSLANALQLLITQESLAQKLAEKAHSKAKEMFDLKTNVSKIEELLTK